MLGAFLFALIIATTMGFAGFSHRFERNIKSSNLDPILSYPLVSVIVPTYKSEKTISKTLRSVKNSDYPSKEIIVVNDSQDKTPEIARGFNARVFQNKTRTGKAAALNKASKKARGEFLLLLDSDTTLQKDTISTLMRSYNHYTQKGEKVGIVAPAYTASNSGKIIARLSDMEQKLHQNLLKIQMNLGSILSIRGSCLLTEREVFEKVGGFSHTLLEDGDFNAKIIRAGYSIKYEPRTTVKIREPETLSSLLRAKKRYGKGIFYCASNHLKPYIFSWQAFVCFFPQFLLLLAIVGLLMFQNPLTLAPITILLASVSLSGISSYITIAVIAALSMIGTVIGTQALTAHGAARAGATTTILPFVLFFVPVVTIYYARGFFAGISDRLHGRPELEFSNW